MKIKLLMGFLYFGWNIHYYNLGSHLGILMNLKCIIIYIKFI
jgi:hypothetical protein